MPWDRDRRGGDVSGVAISDRRPAVVRIRRRGGEIMTQRELFPGGALVDLRRCGYCGRLPMRREDAECLTLSCLCRSLSWRLALVAGALDAATVAAAWNKAAAGAKEEP